MKEINKRLKNIELWLDNMSDKNKETYSLLIKADIKAIKEQLLIHSVVLQSEQLPKTNCTLNRQTCGKGSGCKYPHCHL